MHIPFAKASSKIEHSSSLLASGDVMGAPVPRTAPLSLCAAGLPLSDKEDWERLDGYSPWAYRERTFYHSLQSTICCDLSLGEIVTSVPSMRGQPTAFDQMETQERAIVVRVIGQKTSLSRRDLIGQATARTRISDISLQHFAGREILKEGPSKRSSFFGTEHGDKIVLEIFYRGAHSKSLLSGRQRLINH